MSEWEDVPYSHHSLDARSTWHIPRQARAYDYLRVIVINSYNRRIDECVKWYYTKDDEFIVDVFDDVEVKLQGRMRQS